MANQESKIISAAVANAAEIGLSPRVTQAALQVERTVRGRENAWGFGPGSAAEFVYKLGRYLAKHTPRPS